MFNSTENTFFVATHGTISRMSHIYNLKKYKRLKKILVSYQVIFEWIYKSTRETTETKLIRYNNIFLNNYRVVKEIVANLKKSKIKWNRNIAYKNLCYIVRALLSRSFTVMNSCIKKLERSQINNLIKHLMDLEKQQEAKSKPAGGNK
jgi:hypothetical protein